MSLIAVVARLLYLISIDIVIKKLNTETFVYNFTAGYDI